MQKDKLNIFFCAIKKHLDNINTKNYLFILITQSCFLLFGQDARDDVGGAQNAGMLGILVKTGRLHF